MSWMTRISPSSHARATTRCSRGSDLEVAFEESRNSQKTQTPCFLTPFFSNPSSQANTGNRAEIHKQQQPKKRARTNILITITDVAPIAQSLRTGSEMQGVRGSIPRLGGSRVSQTCSQCLRRWLQLPAPHPRACVT